VRPSLPLSLSHSLSPLPESLTLLSTPCRLEITHEIEDADSATADSPITIKVQLERDVEEDEEVDTTVVAPFFPNKSTTEGWYILVVDQVSKQLWGVKRVTVARRLATSLEFTLPKGEHKNLKLLAICSSYVGADQELDIAPITVAEADDSDEDDSDDAMSE